jgi:hypothetical protein
VSLPDRQFGRDVYRLDQTGRVLIWDGSRDEGGSTTAGEIYLRLADLDLSRPSDILEFANEYDKLNVFEASLSSGSFAIPLSQRETRAMSRGRVELGEVMMKEDPHGFSSPKEWADNELDSESVLGFQVGARTLSDGLRAWRLLRGDIEFDEVEWESDEFEYARLRTGSRKERRTGYQLGAVDSLINLFDFALRPFHPGISIDHSTFGTRGEVELSLEPSHVRQGLDLYPICALELFRHVVEEANYSVCENETCGPLFVRQIGRAKYGQHRTRGVLYCTSNCARAQAQRMYRRRNR